MSSEECISFILLMPHIAWMNLWLPNNNKH